MVVALRIDPQADDAGGATAVFRDELVARWLDHARGNEKLIWYVKPLRPKRKPRRAVHMEGYDGGGPRLAMAGGETPSA
jgi:hypothetical protein